MVACHGETVEILVDNPELFVVRSLERTYKDQDGKFWKFVKAWKKEEMGYE